MVGQDCLVLAKVDSVIVAMSVVLWLQLASDYVVRQHAVTYCLSLRGVIYC